MSSHTAQNRETVDLVRRPVFVTSLVASLALGGLTGCSWDGASKSSSRAHVNTSNSQYWQSTQADLADATIEPEVGRYNTAWYETTGSQENLPEWYVAEAKLQTNDLETRRAEAQASYVAAEAGRAQGYAQLDAKLQAAFAREQAAVADADALSESFASEGERLFALVAAHEAAIENEANMGDALIRATITEREAEFEKFRADAIRGWEQAQAQHGLMVAQRTKVLEDGQAEISGMMKIADMTEARTNAKLAALRSESDAVEQQAFARVNSLDTQITTAEQRFGAQARQLRTQAHAIEDQSVATAAELNARADALESGKAGADYQHRLESADLDFKQTQAEALRLTQQAQAAEGEVLAEVERRLAFAEKFLQIAEAEHQHQRAAAERQRQHGLADVSVMRARADRLEREARADFVLAQAQAYASALREEALQMNELAESQFEQVRAEAEAEAAAIQAEVLDTLASQFAAGNMTFDRDRYMAQVDSDAPVPSVPNIASIPGVVEPGHVASFKTALGETAMLRAQADAFERSLLADFQENTAHVETNLTIAQAEFDEMVAGIEAFSTQGELSMSDLAHNAANMIVTGDAELDYAKADADSIKKELQAAIMNLRAEAEATTVKGEASVTQLLSEANVVETSGEAEVQALIARRDAIQRRGNATVRQIVAEANALQTTQDAMIAQMRQEVQSAKSILNAELARLDQAAESFLQIGEATYEEGLASADSFNAKTAALVEQMYAENDAVRLAAKADIEHMRTIARADELIGEGQVQRLLAQAEAETNIAASFDTARRAAIDAGARVSEAQLASALTKTDAQEDTIKSVFDARLASVKADRNRAFARQFVNDAQREARIAQAQAAADAYRQLSSDALAQLQDKRVRFENAAQENWDSRLALPTRLLTDESAGESWNATTGVIGVAEVPLED